MKIRLELCYVECLFSVPYPEILNSEHILIVKIWGVIPKVKQDILLPFNHLPCQI